MGPECSGGLTGRRFQYVLQGEEQNRRPWIKLLRLADNWDNEANPMAKNRFGVWEVTVPAVNGSPAIPHESKIKVSPSGWS